MIEVWKPVVGWEDLYHVSNFGNVKALAKTLIFADGREYTYKEKILKISPVGQGKYPTVHFYRDKNRTTYAIHRLVAEAFIPNPYGKLTVNHIDGNKLNNHYKNLEWSTYSENNKHALDNGLKEQTPSGIRSRLTRLSEKQVLFLYEKWVPKTKGKYGSRYFAELFGVSQETIRKYIEKKEKISSQIGYEEGI